MKQTPFDTIAAVSSPPGEGGIGIVRLSGDDALEIVSGIFRPYRGTESLENKLSFSMILGHITDNGRNVDEVLVSVMRKPHTYTREDVVEINCHGGAVAVNEVLRLVLASGARLAYPGEFTKRAFINGRIDLAQAEAVLDIVRAKTARSLEKAVGQLDGTLSEKIDSVSNALKEVLVLCEASIDFPEEEDVGPFDYRTVKKKLFSAEKEIAVLTESFETGRVYRDGVFTVIVGKPNVGKSSIMNAFLRFDRAIVTPIPGTTRDIIEEQLNIDGVPFILADTAGITNTNDIVEKEGISRSRSAISKAGLALVVFDYSSGIDERDIEIAKSAKHTPHILIINKTDLERKMDLGRVAQRTGLKTPFVMLSAKTGNGLKSLEKRMVDMVRSGGATGDYTVMVTNRRHFESLRKSKSEIDHALQAVAEKRSLELLAFDVKNAVDSLGEITGRVANDELLEEIFNRFCIGK
ncbi:MAG: tRNA uridine-5-carboxymethylaminomethyl(34) synthesis GTPase MnmE [Spirochaetes bacterium]|nr:tRNA uridine-5-carboxymethylaminomethyl(34) synthesis GTPase MnmE [Spirochaetota bacterium]